MSDLNQVLPDLLADGADAEAWPDLAQTFAGLPATGRAPSGSHRR